MRGEIAIGIKAGVSGAELAKRFNVNPSTISHIRKSCGIPRAKMGRKLGQKGKRTHPHKALVRNLKIEGFTYAEIASRLGVTRQRCQQLLRPEGVIKPKHCEKCRKQVSSFSLHGHHEDYSKDEVTWLCNSCHCKETKPMKGSGGQMRFGRMIECWRQMERKTLRETAREIGIPFSTLYRFERGKSVESGVLAAIIGWAMTKWPLK